MQIRILIADDHPLIRRGLRMLLEQQPGWHVIGEAATGREAVLLARALAPEVVVMDLSMPELGGLDATRQILGFLPEAEVLILTLHRSEELVQEVLAVGARGYVLKSDAECDLIAAVTSARQHIPFFSTAVAEFVHRALETKPAAQSLTPREEEVLRMLAQGRSIKEVARGLNVSVKTADNHRTNLMRKLDVHSAAELLRYAIRHHIVEP